MLYSKPRRIRPDTEAAVKLELQLSSKRLAFAYCMVYLPTPQHLAVIRIEGYHLNCGI